MKIAPVSKLEHIIPRLNEIGYCFDITKFRFELNGFKLDAKKIIPKDPEWGYSLLGIISCIENNYEDMHKFHQKAIDASGGGLISYIQYANSLAHVHDHQNAFEFAFKAHQIDPSNVDVLKTLLISSYYIKDQTKYKKYKMKLNKLKVTYPDPNDFDEDDEKILWNMIQNCDNLLDSNPELIEEPDPNLLNEIESLIEGVDIS